MRVFFTLLILLCSGCFSDALFYASPGHDVAETPEEYEELHERCLNDPDSFQTIRAYFSGEDHSIILYREANALFEHEIAWVFSEDQDADENWFPVELMTVGSDNFGRVYAEFGGDCQFGEYYLSIPYDSFVGSGCVNYSKRETIDVNEIPYDSVFRVSVALDCDYGGKEEDEKE